MTSTKEEPRTANTESEAERRHREGAAAVAAQEHGWFENLTELDGEEEEGSVEGLTPEVSGEPKTLTLTEAVMQLGWTGKALHFDPYAGAWLVLRESGQIGARGATWPEAVSDALGGTVVPVDEATEVRLAAKKLLAELSKLAEAYVFEVQHGAVPDAMEALEAALGVPVVARDEAAELRAVIREWVRATDEFRRHVRETEALPENEGMGHAPIQAALDLDHAEAELRRLAGGENER